jgi:thiol-disulfide isomerase/thioredoxin
MARVTKAQARQQQRQQREEEKRRAQRRGTLIKGGAAVSVVAALAVLLVLLWPAPQEGDTTAEAWDLPQLGGEGRVALADFRGKPTVAAFFASWCEVCEEEIPEYLAVSELVGDQVHFVGINTQDRGAGLSDAEKWGIAGVWPLAEDIGNGNGSGLNTGTFGMRGSPSTAFYDAEGNMIHFQRGGLSGAQLLDALEQLYGVTG